MAPRVRNHFDDLKRAVYYRRQEIERKALDILKLMAYVEPDNGFTEEVNVQTRTNMIRDLDRFSKELRECDREHWTIERLEREALERLTEAETLIAESKKKNS
jgi:hypothetical protein